MESLIIRNSLYGHLWQQCPLHGVSFTLWFCVALEGLNTFTGMNGTHGNQHAKLWAGSPSQSVRSWRKHLQRWGDGLLTSPLFDIALWLFVSWDNASLIVMLIRKHHIFFPLQICENTIKMWGFMANLVYTIWKKNITLINWPNT